MKNIKLFSLGTALGLVTLALPAVAADCSTANTSANWSVSRVADAVALDQLPPKVQATVRGQAGADQIHQIKAETKDGQTVYCVEFNRSSAWRMRPELIVAADGSIVKEKHMGNIVNEAAGSSNR